ncbi:alpha/beta-hydrolase [Macroventuria anomochaeta]|uniref:Alpha/beta-hydrolase n=1 Tax=Macroventuria anomochaeta TaxID=301207 RepID=A0ACB6S085_9PLEO|nr:alpha/beta-hydrolase [Macroventuria anomochaeta]KAF2626922.1 alpha/beta-hydrolase [Macroventuria anomochaeta]
MPTTTAKPTILIIPGSFSAYGAYDPFLTLLRAEGFTALAIKLPSTQMRHPLPPATLQDDAAHVRGVVERLIAEGEGTEVVVLAHSYGGSVATEALAGLGVKRLVFLSASAPRVGENQIKAMRLEAGFLPEEVVILQGGYMHMDPVIMAPFVCNDLPYSQAYENALQLPHHSAVSFQSEVTQTSYKDIPVTYIYCERDIVIAPEIQQRFIDTIEEVSGSKVDVRRIDAGHCPNWSKPDELVKLLVGAAQM